MDRNELIKWAMGMLKLEFTAWREPPVELPADSVIERVIVEIIDRTLKPTPHQVRVKGDEII